ncbi:protein-glutamate methylesterase/protein-glutamine glutaminase [Natronospora cellulosivora (SeqCode)]
MINVMVVDDSSFMRQIFKKTIEENPNLNVITTAGDGIEALEKLNEHQVDVITLDIDMPIKNGLETLKEIMNLEKPIPTIMVSAMNDKETVMTALELGAFDFIPKPAGSISLSIDQIEDNLIEKISVAANLKKIPFSNIKTIEPYNDKISKKALRSKYPIIVIGTSSGGPKALSALLPVFPADIPAAILIVQHMPAGFTNSFAKRLDQESSIHVKEAQNNDQIEPGLAIVAPGDYHMEVTKEGKIVLMQTEKKWSVRPSVDHTLISVAQNFKERVIGVILTGMGRDGSEGMEALKKNGGYGLVEDESTALVYGMPSATIKTNAYDEILPLDQIPYKIIDLLERR